MFSSPIDSLTTPSAADLKLLDEAMAVLNENNREKEIKFSTERLANLKDFKPSTVFKLCQSEANTQFKALCMDEKLPHTEVWAKYLKEKNCAGVKFNPLDKEQKESCTVMDQYLGYFLFSKYNRIKHENQIKRDKLAEEIINQAGLDKSKTTNFQTELTNKIIQDDKEEMYILGLACQYSIFPALVERCRVNAARLMINENQTSNTADLYIGIYLYSKYAKLKLDGLEEKSTLALAKQYPTFQELLERSHQTADGSLPPAPPMQSIIKPNPQQIKFADDQLQNDAHLVGNLYMTVGYLEMALILLDIGSFYANKDELAVANQKQKMAVEFFLRASYLNKYKNFDLNEKAVKAICKNRKLEVVFGATWDAADKYFFRSLDKRLHNEATIRTTILTEISSKISSRPASPSRNKVYGK